LRRKSSASNSERSGNGGIFAKARSYDLDERGKLPAGIALCVALAPTNSSCPTAAAYFAIQATPVFRQAQAAAAKASRR
jgi:hypothetical protein